MLKATTFFVLLLALGGQVQAASGGNEANFEQENEKKGVEPSDTTVVVGAGAVKLREESSRRIAEPAGAADLPMGDKKPLPPDESPLPGTQSEIDPGRIPIPRKAEQQQVSGQSTMPLNSEAMGFANLGEYRAAMPEMESELQNAFQHAQKFRRLMQEVAQEKRADRQKLQEMERLAGQRVRGLESVPEADNQPSGNPLLSQNERSRIPAAAEDGYSLPAVPRNFGSGFATGPIDRGSQFESMPGDARRKINRPDSLFPETKERSQGESDSEAVAKEFAGKGDLKNHSTIALAEKANVMPQAFAAENAKAVKAGGRNDSAKLAKAEGGKREKKTLREALLRGRGNGASEGGERPEESAAQNVLRSALETVGSAEQKAGSAAGGGTSSESTFAQFGGQRANGEAFALAGSETDAAIRDFTKSVDENKGATGVLGVDSDGLFERIHAAHRRSEKSWRQQQLQANL